MADSFTDLQALIRTRILAHADLSALTVVTEADGSTEAALDAGVLADGIAADILVIDFLPTGSRDQYQASFVIEVKEDVENNSFGKTAWEVASAIFNQLRNWTPSATWQRVGDLKIETVEIEPFVIRQISGETRIQLS